MTLSSGERQVYRIYALVDPLTGEPHYVGQTAATLADRRRDHVRKPGSTKKGAWIRELLAEYREPQIVLIEEFTGCRREAYERESFWIRQLQSEGRPILN
ncbi:GIY-YIG nuclease family protein (plasmid) [Curtobacterium sp. C1]|uniref:GIY-YIG nuclease family protein n=1 Tax=Curtobacterium sp. C1 TaxID=2898151 RepID=UPI001E4C5C13|nr:GIY-YIG nuclease family protein [Curtobacterium sp. C1]UFU16067.1 GIY-YIG nuclease family protein [Curtobacterium sp. C1]